VCVRVCACVRVRASLSLSLSLRYLSIHHNIHNYNIWFMGTVEYRSALLHSTVLMYQVNNIDLPCYTALF
jgi:hypothetical protein